MKIGKRKPSARTSAVIARSDYCWREIDFVALRKEWAEKEAAKKVEPLETRRTK